MTGVVPALFWRGEAWSDPFWMAARLLLAINWAYNAYPGKFQARWYEHDFAQRVGYFAAGNPWPPVHAFLESVVLTHAAVFAGVSAAGETAAALLLVFPITTRLGGAVAAAVGLSYSLSMDWVNLGYSAHNGSFGLLGLLYLVLGGWLPRTRAVAARSCFVLIGVAGLAVAYPLAFRWEGVLPTLPWLPPPSRFSSMDSSTTGVDAMISTGQILAAGVITALAVAVAAGAVRWPSSRLVAGAVLTFILIAAWRWISNLVGLNGDYIPLVSVADTLCLIAGALGPALVASRELPFVRRWLPALVGGVVGFSVNVVIL